MRSAESSAGYGRRSNPAESNRRPNTIHDSSTWTKRLNDYDPDPPDDADDDFLYEERHGDAQDEHEPPPPYRSPFQQSAAGPSYTSVPCSRCGYNLTGVTIGGNCPECGADIDRSLFAAGHAPANGMAITSMVIGIIAASGLCCCPTGYLGILGLIFGGVALNQINEGSYNNASRGMATAGLICSGVGLVLAFVWTLLLFMN